MPIKATFSSHSIRPDGLHIFSVTDDGVEIETVISRDDATLFGWIEEEDGIYGDDEYIGTEYQRNERKKRDLAKLEEWNRLATRLERTF